MEVLKNKRIKDLAGKRFGRLVVLRDSFERKNHNIIWECICDCGKKVFVNGGFLKLGKTKSCGCSRSQDLSGKKFGRLTVIYRRCERIGGRVTYVCLCDCGIECVACSSDLILGRKKSCGSHNIKNLEGRKFGFLTVLYLVDDKSRSAKWMCRCDCGRKKIVYSGSLQSGGTKSCGCLSKYDLTGRKFGRLRVLSDSMERRKKQIVYKCVCDCGKTKYADSYSLLNGNVKSCGCLRIEKGKERMMSDEGALCIAKMQLSNRSSIDVASLPAELIETQALRIKINREIRRIEDEKY